MIFSNHVYRYQREVLPMHTEDLWFDVSIFFLFNHHVDNYYTKKIVFIFGFVLFHIKSFCIFLSWSIALLEIVLTGARWIILDKAKVLETAIMSSKVKFLRFHNFSRFLEFLSYFLLESQISYCSVQPYPY